MCGTMRQNEKRQVYNMFMIVGLGNPTLQYEGTRHNVGFDVIDTIAEKYHISVTEKQKKALCGKGVMEGRRVLLVKPQTYMNLSGESVRALADFYKLDPESEILVIFDDVSLDVGQLRIRKKGSAGGHNGIKSLIAHLGTDGFLRIKVGVGEKPKGYDLADYVLGHFTKEEKEILKDSYQAAAEAALFVVQGEIEEAMNRYNRKGKS